MMFPPSAPPRNGGTTPITLEQHTHNPAWGGSGTVATPVLCWKQSRQPGRGWVKVVWAIYYLLLVGMFATTIGGLMHWWEEHQAFQREAREQARAYNASIDEMERILKQMKKQKMQLEEEAKR